MIHPGIDKVIALLREAGEERFNMGCSCGSVCCIGGHCKRHLETKGIHISGIGTSLSVVAEISPLDSDRLCFPPRVFDEDGIPNWFYADVTLSEAISVLEHYRDTGIVDWSPVSQRLEREAVR